jgi:hypothetical protein
MQCWVKLGSNREAGLLDIVMEGCGALIEGLINTKRCCEMMTMKEEAGIFEEIQ